MLKTEMKKDIIYRKLKASKCLNTRFSLPTLLYTEYSVKLKIIIIKKEYLLKTVIFTQGEK